MNKLITVSFLLLSLLTVACKHNPKTNVGEAAAYICPMHPAEVSITPGVCAVCKMALIPMEAPAAAYTCPMHPDLKSDKPGTCPECKMDLEPVKPKE